MIRFFLRLVGLLCLAGAFLLVIYDGTKSIAGNGLAMTTVRTLWETINAASLQSLQPLVENTAGRVAWDPIFTGFLGSPSWAVLGAIGVVLLMIGRKRRPLIGYAR